jgi:hypothetical protein
VRASIFVLLAHDINGDAVSRERSPRCRKLVATPFDFSDNANNDPA